MGEFLLVVGAGIVAILVAVIAEKSGRKILVVSITIVLCLVLGLIGIFYDLKWFIASGIAVFLGVVMYIARASKEEKRRKRERKRKGSRSRKYLTKFYGYWSPTACSGI